MAYLNLFPHRESISRKWRVFEIFFFALLVSSDSQCSSKYNIFQARNVYSQCLRHYKLLYCEAIEWKAKWLIGQYERPQAYCFEIIRAWASKTLVCRAINISRSISPIFQPYQVCEAVAVRAFGGGISIVYYPQVSRPGLCHVIVNQ